MLVARKVSWKRALPDGTKSVFHVANSWVSSSDFSLLHLSGHDIQKRKKNDLHPHFLSLLMKKFRKLFVSDVNLIRSHFHVIHAVGNRVKRAYKND